MSLWEELQVFGLTQYEARAYVSLVRLGPSNAYQVSKESGIPRARVYDTLDALARRGIVMVEEAEDGARTYTPLPVDVFLEQVKESWEEAFARVGEELRRAENREPERDSYVATVRGEGNILSFCRILIRRARRQILLSMWRPMYERLLPELAERQERGCTLKGIVFQVDDPLPGLDVHRRNAFISDATEERWFILSVDGKELLYGHSAERNGNAFYTDDPVHLYLLEDYIWHDVLVNRLVARGSQEQLDAWILPEMERFFGRPMLPKSPG